MRIGSIYFYIWWDLEPWRFHPLKLFTFENYVYLCYLVGLKKFVPKAGTSSTDLPGTKRKCETQGAKSTKKKKQAAEWYNWVNIILAHVFKTDILNWEMILLQT